MQNLTGHQVHKVANELLVEHGLKTIPPQLVYNYIKSGRIAIVDEDGMPSTYEELKGNGYWVTPEATVEWVREFVSNRRNPSNTSSELVTQLVAELRAEA